MTIDETTAPPFVAALGQALDRVAPIVRRQLVLPDRRALHGGSIRRLWSRGVAGWIAARLLNLVGGDSAIGAQFELRNELLEDERGIAMLWRRTYHSGTELVSAVGVMRWDPVRRVLIDSTGRGECLEVELIATVEQQAVVMTSRRCWLRVGWLRIRLLRVLFGSARTREWEEPDGRLGLSLTLHHPLLGPYAGYEAVLSPGEAR